MPQRFEFNTAHRIIFGPGTLQEVPVLVQGMGRRALVVTGTKHPGTTAFLKSLRAAGFDLALFPVDSEPTVATIRHIVMIGRQAQCELVIGFGGGSVLDTAKAAAALITNPGDILDYLEIIGKGHTLEKPSVPFVAIPTTAGTGSEATRNAVIGSPEHRVKASLRSPFMLPWLAVVDPELTLSLPPAATASTGMDALTQLIEPFVSNAPNPLTDALCREGIRHAAHSLKQACKHGDDIEARTDLALASLMSGMALANAKLGAVHGFANPIGGMYPAPHGAICARLLAPVMEANLKALRSRYSNSPAIERFDEVAQLLTGKPGASAEDGIEWLRALVADLGIPRLAEYGLTAAGYSAIADQAAKSNSMKGNPVVLTRAELIKILESSG
jgi:alcohol dehydrogenase class IV